MMGTTKPQPTLKRHHKNGRNGKPAKAVSNPTYYDPETIEAILSFDTCRKDFKLWLSAVERFFILLRFFLSILWMTWWDRQIWSYIGEEDIDRAQSLRRHEHGRRITEKLLYLGPTFIKVGQSLSTRVDLLRKEYIEELSKLQDRVPQFGIEDVRRIIREELGDEPEQLFQSFNPQPIAAASLGQVHRVVLHTGEEAVIKVQRPNLTGLFAIDLCVLKRAARALQRSTELGRGREWVYIVDEFGRTLFEEIDYIQEGRNADHFRRNFAGWPNILIPKIYWKYTSRRVIAMEYQPGIKVNDLSGLEAAGFSRADISVQMVKAYFQQLLMDGFFHADPHPGNIVVNADGKIVFYDYGMVGTILDDTRLKIVTTFLNIVNKRTDAILTNLQELNMVTPGADMEEIRAVVDWALENYYDVPHDQLNFEELADEMAEVMYYYPFKLPATFTFMFRALITLEGVATTLYPQIQFMSLAVDYARDFTQKSFLIEKLLAPGAAENYPKLFREGLELLGISGKGKAAVPGRVRLYHEEWKPLARYVKAGFILLALGQTTMIVMLMAVLLIFIYRYNPGDVMLAIICMSTFLMGYLIITFCTLLLMPARKKPFHFNPPKRLNKASPAPSQSGR